jgi:hemerythrin-like domain-containing protein
MMRNAADEPDRRRRFEASMLDYIAAYLEHIRTEERQVLPLAERMLTQDDWRELDAAFMQNRDPLTHREPDDAYRPLFKQILMSLPSPLGLGPAMEALYASSPRSPA